MPEKTELKEATLCIGKLGGVAALDAVKSLPARDGLNILIYTPDFCGFVKVDGEKLIKLAGDGVPTDSVFELRAFCPDFDLRWVREDKDGKGRVSVIAESEKSVDFEGMKWNKEDYFKHSGRYLLWGKGKGGRLFEHRVGELPVPVKLTDGQHVYLDFEEYFRADDYGNQVWYAERLTGLTAE